MSGDRGSVSGVLVCWSLDLGSTPDRSLSFSFPLDHLGLSILTTKLNDLICPENRIQDTDDNEDLKFRKIIGRI